MGSSSKVSETLKEYEKELPGGHIEEDENSSESDGEEYQPFKASDLIYYPERLRNAWLISRGKPEYVEFHDEERK